MSKITHSPPFGHYSLGPILHRADNELFQALPEYDMVGSRVYNQCAIVGSSGSLLNFQLGREIDRHDMILRFNGAPTQVSPPPSPSFLVRRAGPGCLCSVLAGQ
jgi:hypothetical protein